MKALVTGADGFIGSHLVEELIDHGHQVRAFCFYNSTGSLGWLENVDKGKLENIEVMLGDIRDPDCVHDAMTNCTHIFHLAALIGIPYSYIAPKSYIETNIIGTFNVLQSARRHEADHVILTSTSETYGTAQYVPMDEAHPQLAQSPYAATKIAADQLGLSFWQSYQTPVSILRPFNTYGPRQSARAVIPTLITQMLSATTEIRLGSIEPTRDFNYVKDVCRAFISVATTDLTIGKVLNVATGYEITIGELVHELAALLGIAVKIKAETERVRPPSSEVYRLLGDSSKLRETTGWAPKYSGPEGLRDGLSETISWYRTAQNIQRYKPNFYSI